MAKPRPGTLEHLAVLAPDAVVLIEHGTGRAHTRASWDERAGSLAVALREQHGVGHGSRVAFLLDGPSLELFELVLALAKLGAAPVPLVPGLDPGHLPDVLTRAQAAAFLTDDAEAARGTDAILTGEGYEALLDGAPAGPRPTSGVRVAPVSLVAAAGATAGPRLVERADDRMNRAELSQLLGDLATRAGHRPSRGHLVAAPPWLPATLLHANIALLAGAALTVLPAFTPTGWLEALAEHEPGTAVLSPAMVAGLVALPPAEQEEQDTSTLDAAVVAGDHLPVPHRAAAADLLGLESVVCVYATAEAGPVAALAGEDLAEDPGTAGTPLQAVHVEIRGDDGTTVPRGAPGAVHVRSPLAAGAPVTTGDLGVREDDGRLRLLGRSGTPVWTDPEGRPVGTLAVRDVLHGDPAVAAVAVDAPSVGGAPRIRVELAPGTPPDPEGLTDRLREAIGPDVAAGVEIVAALPRDALGRVRP